MQDCSDNKLTLGIHIFLGTSETVSTVPYMLVGRKGSALSHFAKQKSRPDTSAWR